MEIVFADKSRGSLWERILPRHLADLTCYAFEAQAMDRQVRSGNIAHARDFIGTFRYIDDILSVDNPDFGKSVRLVGSDNQVDDAIYPEFLSLNETTDSSRSVGYLGVTIRNMGRQFQVNVADTKNKFPFPKINYPSLLGNFPEPSAYGMFTGQLHRFARICTKARPFLSWSAMLCKTLLPKGYKITKLYKSFKSFITEHSPYKTRTPTMFYMLNRLVESPSLTRGELFGAQV